MAAGGGLITTALTRNGLTGLDDNTAQGNQLVPVEPEVWQQQGSKLQPMGTMRRGNGNVTGGVPFLATTLTRREGKGPDSGLTSGNVVTRALTAEGADASEDGTGRGTPLVPVAYALRADPGGVGQGHNTNYVPEGRSDPGPAVVGFSEASGGNAAHTELAPAVRTGAGGGATFVAAAAVRRLTPVECERLQGFPDDWTLRAAKVEQVGNEWTTIGEVEQADSPRYRQLGNSIAVPVFEWVANRIVEVDRHGRG